MKFAIMVSTCVLVATAAAATDKPVSKPLDPDKMICEREEILGSRLQARKVCMTRAQWAERRRQDRDLVDRSQSSSCMRQGGC